MRFAVAVLAAVVGSAVGGVARSATTGERPTVHIDLKEFELRAKDPARPDGDLVLLVATGSPAHPTPRGRFRPWRVVRNPAWVPGPIARAAGARRMPPSERTPMGIAKISLSPDGFTLHAGADPLLLGKPVSLGCLRLADTDMLRLIDWLQAGGLLGPAQSTPEGELHHPLLNGVTFEVR